MLCTTFALTCIGWIFFRAKSMSDAWYILTHVASNWDFGQIATEQFLMRQMPIAIAGIVVLELVQVLQNRIAISATIARLPVVPRWSLYSSLIMLVVMFGVYRKAQFIYFQF